MTANTAHTDRQPLDLDPIRGRRRALEEAWDFEYCAPDGPAKAIASAEDVPALLAEIERLRAETAEDARFAEPCEFTITGHVVSGSLASRVVIERLAANGLRDRIVLDLNSAAVPASQARSTVEQARVDQGTGLIDAGHLHAPLLRLLAAVQQTS